MKCINLPIYDKKTQVKKRTKVRLLCGTFQMDSFCRRFNQEMSDLLICCVICWYSRNCVMTPLSDV